MAIPSKNNCNCGKSGNLPGCGCYSPIELITQGLQGNTGPAGPAGNNGASGIALLFSNIVNYHNTVGLTGETLFTYNVDNTPLQQLVSDGDCLKMTVMVEHKNPNVSNFRAVEMSFVLNNGVFPLPKQQVYNGGWVSTRYDFIIKRINSTTLSFTYIGNTGYTSGNIVNSLNTFVPFPFNTTQAYVAVNDFPISLYAKWYDTSSTPYTAIPFDDIDNVKITNIIIEKYLL